MSIHDEQENKIGLFTIWAIGVGSALGGVFFGWQFVLIGGFFSGLLALAFSGLFYWIYASAITELSARYKSTGGAYDFVKISLGHRAATFMAMLNLLKLILANAATALTISSYMTQGGLSSSFSILCIFATYFTFTLLDCIGIRQSSSLQIIATILCVSIVLFYCTSNFTIFSIKNLKSEGYITSGLTGFLTGLPYSLQFFDGFEEIPLLMSYAVNPTKTIPDGILLCYFTVLSIAILVLVSGTGSSDNATLLLSEAPLMDGIEAIYGLGSFISNAVAYLIVLGLFVNFFAFVIYLSQQVQVIAEAGQLPKFLSYRHPITGAPIMASICSGITGIFITIIFWSLFGEANAQNTLLSASLMPTIIGYILVLQCIIKLQTINILMEQGANVKIFCVLYFGSPYLSKNTLTDSVLKMGSDPPNHLKFPYGIIGARLGQMMCLVLIIGLLVLACTSKGNDFGNGLIFITFAGVLLYAYMVRFPSNENKVKNYDNDYADLLSDSTKGLIDSSNENDDTEHLQNPITTFLQDGKNKSPMIKIKVNSKSHDSNNYNNTNNYEDIQNANIISYQSQYAEL
eukprot:gene4182-5950_t